MPRKSEKAELVRIVRLLAVCSVAGLCALTSIANTPYQLTVTRSSLRFSVSIQTCKASQLDVGGIGSSAAAGTGIVTIRVTDVSASVCALNGWPTLTFLSGSQRVLDVTTTHNGPGTFFHHSRTIVLRPGLDPTAGFVVTSADFPARNESCQNVSAVRVVLPRVHRVFHGPALDNLTDYHVCSAGNPVNISSITSDPALSGYAPTYPACLSTQLRLSLGPEGAASGSAIESGFLTNKSTAECTIEGYPGLSLFDSMGRRVLTFGPGTMTYTLFDPSRPRPVSLAHGVSARFVFSASDYQPTANNGRGAPCPTSDELRLVLPSGDGTMVSHGAFQLCGLAGVGAFTEAS